MLKISLLYSSLILSKRIKVFLVLKRALICKVGINFHFRVWPACYLCSFSTRFETNHSVRNLNTNILICSRFCGIPRINTALSMIIQTFLFISTSWKLVLNATIIYPNIVQPETCEGISLIKLYRNLNSDSIKYQFLDYFVARHEYIHYAVERQSCPFWMCTWIVNLISCL